MDPPTRQLVGKMGRDYSFDVRSLSISISFSAFIHRAAAGTSKTWLLFRQVVDIILIQ